MANGQAKWDCIDYIKCTSYCCNFDTLHKFRLEDTNTTLNRRLGETFSNWSPSFHNCAPFYCFPKKTRTLSGV